MRSASYIVVSIAVALLGLGITETAGEYYTSTKNKTYFIEPKNKNNWFGSWSSCQRINMTFVIIDSPEKTEEINELINTNFKEKEKPLLFIGANDLGDSNKYEWISSGNALNYTNWHKYEPNHHQNTEHCIMIGLYDDGTWNDVDCYKKLGYICELGAMKETIKTIF